jgi:hypothetical protein
MNQQPRKHSPAYLARVRLALCDLAKIDDPRNSDLIHIARNYQLFLSDLRDAAANRANWPLDNPTKPVRLS